MPREPDVVLMDLSMPDARRHRGDAADRRRRPRRRTSSCSRRSPTTGDLAPIDAGAIGYLLKHAGPDELLARSGRGRAIAARPEGGAGPAEQPHGAGPGAELTAREREVLVLVAAGLANKQIARKLGITERTVKAHLTNVFSASA